MSNTYTHKIILFTADYKGDALVVMANTIQTQNVISKLEKINYHKSTGEIGNWQNTIRTAIVQKGGWELYSEINAKGRSQGRSRGVYDETCRKEDETRTDIKSIQATLELGRK
ncbi:MAG: hypothetical protein V4732_10635 [Pseudomonadota bacterium]